HGQTDQEGGDGCNELDYWFSDAVLHPPPPKEPPKPPQPITMAQLPPSCRAVLHAPDAKN
ncbi:MAG: penicillin-insensitive murein endopeptidase, partial [Bradyrhizobium sp.]|nr:penicillin-insensitive murein endopeptidase [Bradyrhizobium sp.]